MRIDSHAFYKLTGSFQIYSKTIYEG